MRALVEVMRGGWWRRYEGGGGAPHGENVMFVLDDIISIYDHSLHSYGFYLALYDQVVDSGVDHKSSAIDIFQVHAIPTLALLICSA